jgi:hypothetical protein
MANNLGRVNAPTATATIRKNGVAQSAKSASVVPFYQYFSQGKSTIAPPARWITRK